MAWKCFLIEPSGIAVIDATAVWGKGGCTGGFSHRATRELMRAGDAEIAEAWKAQSFPKYESFKAVCEICGVDGGDQVPESHGCGTVWRRSDTGEHRRRISDFGIGAMWRATWYERDRNEGLTLYGWDWDNQIEPPLVVQTPGGDWIIDSRASNCDMLNDRTHRCWVRHGEPPEITVDKAGHTCGAGAGSIQCGSYHGFLRNGYLTDPC